MGERDQGAFAARGAQGHRGARPGQPGTPGQLATAAVPGVRRGSAGSGGSGASAPSGSGSGGVRRAAQVPIPQVPAPPARPESLETATTAEVLGGYLHGMAADFLRSLRLHGESVGSAEAVTATAGAVRRLRRAARRLSGTLHTYRPLVDTVWADQLCAELRWLSDALAREYGYAARLDRLLGALQRLATDGAESGRDNRRDGRAREGPLPVGAARAGALLERQLTLARTRAHSAALQALVSARFHAVADAVALLAYEAPLAPGTADAPAAPALVPLAEQARARLTEAVGTLPLSRAAAPYQADPLARPLTLQAQQDAAWHRVRLLLRLHRYAEEVLLRGPEEGDGAQPPLASASAALDRHRDAAEAAAAATEAARTPRIAPATAYALGVLHADQRHEVEAARFAFGRLWDPARPPDAP